MTLYTIVPEEHIFPVATSSFSNTYQIYYDGIPVVVERQEEGSFRITQILSTDPAHYLNESVQPGTCLSLQGLS
jgi:YlzJ-like protein